jgi:hypothetical protein
MSIEKFLSQIYEVVQESVIFDEKDLYINFDKWKKEKSKNILYITGLSGSGKSTLAEHFESKYAAEMFELDGLEGNYDSSKSNFLKKYKTLHPEIGKLIDSRDFLKLSDEEKFEEYKKFIRWLRDEMHSKPNTLYIIEGMVLYSLNPETLKHDSLIIKGSSMLTSIIQRIKRAYGGSINLKILFNELSSKYWLKKYPWYYQDNKILDKFKSGIT